MTLLLANGLPPPVSDAADEIVQAVATLVTDDFAVQNVAHRLEIAVQPIRQRKAKARTWKYRCTGCGRYFDHPGICDYCGVASRIDSSSARRRAAWCSAGIVSTGWPLGCSGTFSLGSAP